MASAINIFLFSRFKQFQFHVVDYPPPSMEIVSLNQDQALLILCRLPSNRLPLPQNCKFDSRSSTSDFA